MFWDLKKGIFSSDPNVGDFFKLHNYLKRATTIVFHNAKFDIQKLLLAGVFEEDDIQFPGRFDDTMVMAQLLDENRSRRLKDLAKDILGEETDEAKVLQECRRSLGLTVDDGYDKIPLDVLKPYALKDAEFTYRLYLHFMQELRSIDDQRLTDLYRNEMKFILVLLKIEAAGLKVDLDFVKQSVKEYGSKILASKKKIQEITGLKVFDEADLKPREGETKKAAKERCMETTFNPNSPNQVMAVFGTRGIKLKSTGVDEMKQLTDPLASAILELRENVKIKQTYLLGIIKEHHNSIVHPNFRPTGTKTGRLSSGAGE